MGPRPVSVAIVNDFEVVVRGVHAMLEPFADRVQVVELSAQTPGEQQVDVTLYDSFSEPQVDGPEFDELFADGDSGSVVVYSWNTDPDLVEVALAKGCRGYLGKSLGGDALVAAIERVARGEVVVSRTDEVDGAPSSSAPVGEAAHGAWPGRREGLSAREAEIITLIVQGLTNEDIASRTYLSINSVKTYIRTAYRKMGVERRSQAVRWGLEHGMRPQRLRRVDPSSALSRSVATPQAGT